METRAFLTELGNQLEDQLDSNSPVGETAQLSKSWNSRVVNNSVICASSAEHANYPEFGTRGPIRAKRQDGPSKGYLVFYIGGRKIVAREVKGQKPQLYVWKALKFMFPASRISRK